MSSGTYCYGGRVRNINGLPLFQLPTVVKWEVVQAGAGAFEVERN